MEKLTHHSHAGREAKQPSENCCHHDTTTAAAASGELKDPVCGMTVTLRRTRICASRSASISCPA